MGLGVPRTHLDGQVDDGGRSQEHPVGRQLQVETHGLDVIRDAERQCTEGRRPEE
ncbi:hypothetical protein [Streptomyces sp. NPDC001401]|uniref:hypothetical protein n=1 Tax=Streptomyces sp. NPDC001401 TaxID=3364570 RepID=UPI003687C91C